MPVPESTEGPFPKLHHLALHTTFCGLQHPLSTPAAPIHQYRGIKYASIPARFRQSKVFHSYPVITDATTYGPICPQKVPPKSLQESLFGIPMDIIPNQKLQQNEFECLNLNITCPGNLTSRSRVPVMLWIHGGGDHGSGSQWYYDAGALVRKSIQYGKPVIVVNFNFRLGLLGFATNPLIRDDNRTAGEEGTGNYGLRDQRKAMEWLHYYISEFGGDPNNITLFGAGSGGADIIMHLLSRANEEQPPLFHRTIVQSAIFEPILPDVSSAGWHLSRVMSALQITSIEKFRAVEVDKLIGLGQTLRCVDDGVFFREGWQSYFGPEPPAASHGHHHHHHHQSHRLAPEIPSRPITPFHYSKSKSRSPSRKRGLASSSRLSQLLAEHSRQPMIIGDCSCDALLWSGPISSWTSAGVVRRLKAICQSLGKTSALLRAYDISSYTPPEEIMDHVLELVGDARVSWPTHCIAESAKKERGGRNVWRYVFDQEGPSRCVPHHAADVMYLFDNVPLPAAASISSIDESMFDLSDDEDAIAPTAFNGNPPSPPPVRVHTNPNVEDLCEFNSSSFIEKCENLQQQSHNSSRSSASLPGDMEDWPVAVVDEFSYGRVRDAIQERWISFAHGEVPWRDDRVFVFGPEGETGERSNVIFEGRRRTQMWKEALEPLGPTLVQKFGVELSRGPAHGADRS
ncbi:alpha/beta-hydrolase [Pholiota conissans]|uniref:Alpha/beta-hydrolase n=1 Tax=Pholiota conissans TaxID=109636 RepID=A0A9P6CW93_9AGAR|nr:alpha/beta-hydrolase [Pholiota conissans]